MPACAGMTDFKGSDFKDFKVQGVRVLEIFEFQVL